MKKQSTDNTVSVYYGSLLGGITGFLIAYNSMASKMIINAPIWNIGSFNDSKQSSLNVSIGHRGPLVLPQLTLTEKVIYNLFLIVIGAGVGGSLAYWHKRREKKRQSKHYKKQVRQFYEKSFVKHPFEEPNERENFDDIYVKLAVLPERSADAARKKFLHYQVSTHIKPELFVRDELIHLYELALEELKLVDEDQFFRPISSTDEKLVTKAQEIKKIIVRGAAGVGKSTFCKNYARKLTGQGEWAIVVSLRDFYHDNQSITDAQVWIRSLDLDIKNEKNIEFLIRDLEQSNEIIYYILDGYDEIENLSNQNPLRYWLRCLWQKENVKIVLTSRPIVISEFSPDKNVEIIGFLPDDIKKYIDKYFSSSNNFNSLEVKQALNQMLTRENQLSGLAKIPLMLALLCWAYKVNKIIDPSITFNLTEIHQKIWVTLAKKYLVNLSNDFNIYNYSDSQIKEDDRIKRMEIIFNKIAYKAWRLKKTTLDSKLVEEVFEEEKVQAVENKQILNDFGLLVPLVKTKPFSSRMYMFQHLLLQEFFAANHWVRLFASNTPSEEAEAISFLRQSKYDIRYEMMWRFISGLLPESHLNKFFFYMQSVPLDYIGSRHLRLLINCVGERQFWGEGRESSFLTYLSRTVSSETFSPVVSGENRCSELENNKKEEKYLPRSDVEPVGIKEEKTSQEITTFLPLSPENYIKKWFQHKYRYVSSIHVTLPWVEALRWFPQFSAYLYSHLSTKMDKNDIIFFAELLSKKIHLFSNIPAENWLLKVKELFKDDAHTIDGFQQELKKVNLLKNEVDVQNLHDERKGEGKKLYELIQSYENEGCDLAEIFLSDKFPINTLLNLMTTHDQSQSIFFEFLFKKVRGKINNAFNSFWKEISILANSIDPFGRKFLSLSLFLLFDNLDSHYEQLRPVFLKLLQDSDSEVANFTFGILTNFFTNENELVIRFFPSFLKYLHETILDLDDVLGGFILKDQQLILSLAKEVFLIRDNRLGLRVIDGNYIVTTSDAKDCIQILKRLNIPDQIFYLALDNADSDKAETYLNLYNERYDFGHFIFMWDKQKNQWNFMGKNSLGSVVKGPLGGIKELRDLHNIFSNNNYQKMNNDLGDDGFLLEILNLLKSALEYTNMRTFSHADIIGTRVTQDPQQSHAKSRYSLMPEPPPSQSGISVLHDQSLTL